MIGQALSRVMSPVEHVSDMLKQQIYWHENTPKNLIDSYTPTSKIHYGGIIDANKYSIL
mgnify:CR=1 FL=1